MLARWPAQLTASTFNRLGQYTSSPGYRVTQNSPFLPCWWPEYHLQYSLRLPTEVWPGWVDLVGWLDQWNEKWVCNVLCGWVWGGVFALCTARDVTSSVFLTYLHKVWSKLEMQGRCYKKVKSKPIEQFVIEIISPLREITCHVGSHSVTCHPAAVTSPPLPRPKLVLDLIFIDSKRMQGWVDLVMLVI